MNPDKTELLNAVRSILSYHATIGIDRYPKTETLASFLEGPALSLKRRVAAGPVVPVAESGQPPLQQKGDVEDEILSCTGCTLHTHRLRPVPGIGGKRPRLLIVGGWLVGHRETTPESGIVFGPEEDVMISRMLTAIRLSPENVFVTNIIKCALPENCSPSDDSIEACGSFLVRQIAVLQPELICAMGIIPAKALLHVSQPLSRIRGKFYPFAVNGQTSIPVMPTYHPTFLLQNPEFKKAVWEDLQSMARYLKTM